MMYDNLKEKEMLKLLICPVCKENFTNRNSFANHLSGFSKEDNAHTLFYKSIRKEVENLFYDRSLTATNVSIRFKEYFTPGAVLKIWKDTFGKVVANERIKEVNKTVRKGRIAWNKGKKYGKPKKLYINTCQWEECGKEFETTSKHKKTCCNEHRYKLNKIKEAKTKGIIFADLRERFCKNCGDIFKPDFKGVETCSVQCGYELRSKEQLKNTLILNCEICNQPFKNRDKGYSKPRTCGKPSCEREILKRTNLERYGVENPSQSSEIQQRRIKNSIKNYGVSFPQQKHISPDILEEFNNKEFLEDLHITQQIPIETIAHQFNVSSFFVASYLKKANIETHNYGNSFEGKQLCKYIESLDFSIQINNRSILPSGKELDIYIPNKKIGIEYNGLFWHSEQQLKSRNLTKNYHLDKTKEAESLGIQLIHIFEDDWLYKKDIVKSRLLQVLNVSKEKLYARNSIIKEITYQDSCEFLNKYHLQGAFTGASIYLGLFIQNSLVACMLFGSLRKALGSDTEVGNYELLRFCSKNSVVGGASKLFSYFVNSYKPLRVISYADRHWTTLTKLNLYDRLGFVKISEGIPNYWYVSMKGVKEHRYNYRKSELIKKLEIFDDTLSEYQNMLNNKYDRIWGCGSLKYEWVNV